MLGAPLIPNSLAMSFQMKLNLWLTGGFLLADGPSPAGSRPKKKPGASAPGFVSVWYRKESALSGLFGHHGLVVGLRLRAAARTLGERGFDLLDRFGLGDALHGRNLARQPVERGFVELPLRIGLFGL